MNKKLVLYLGIHKTATTTIQATLEEAAPDLARQHVTYIPLREMRLTVTPALTDLTGKGQAAFFKSVDSRVSRCLLLSDENILGKSNDITNGNFYPFAETRISNLVAAFKGYDLEIILALRNPATFLPSVYCEFVRHYAFRSFQNYVGGIDLKRFSWVNYLGWVTRLRATGAKVNVIPFEADLGGGPRKILDTISAAVGAELPEKAIDINFKVHRRSSFTAEEIHAFNQLFDASNAPTVKTLIRAMERGNESFGKTKFDPLDPALKTILGERYKQELGQLQG